MKIGFSTLGCPGWSWNDIFATAKDLGYDGIEIRGVGKDMFAPSIPAFHPLRIGKTRERLEKAGLEIPMLTSGAAVALPAERDAAASEIAAYIDTAHALGTPYVRVFLSNHAAPVDFEDLDFAKGFYTEMCAVAADKGVRLLLETAGKFCDTTQMAAFMSDIPEKGSGVLWDLHHPFRFHGESPAETYQNIGKYVHHIHLKDSAMVNDKVQYCLMGYGSVPVRETLELLAKEDFSGFVSLEWLKRWCPDLSEPGIVFSQFIHYMKK